MNFSPIDFKGFPEVESRHRRAIREWIVQQDWFRTAVDLNDDCVAMLSELMPAFAADDSDALIELADMIVLGHLSDEDTAFTLVGCVVVEVEV